jgi:hypothetical protein
MGFIANPCVTTSSPSFSCLDGFWPSHGHRCLLPGDSTQMIPQPTFIENDTDPGSRGHVWGITPSDLPQVA